MKSKTRHEKQNESWTAKSDMRRKARFELQEAFEILQRRLGVLLDAPASSGSLQNLLLKPQKPFAMRWRNWQQMAPHGMLKGAAHGERNVSELTREPRACLWIARNTTLWLNSRWTRSSRPFSTNYLPKLEEIICTKLSWTNYSWWNS